MLLPSRDSHARRLQGARVQGERIASDLLWSWDPWTVRTPRGYSRYWRFVHARAEPWVRESRPRVAMHVVREGCVPAVVGALFALVLLAANVHPLVPTLFLAAVVVYSVALVGYTGYRVVAEDEQTRRAIWGAVNGRVDARIHSSAPSFERRPEPRDPPLDLTPQGAEYYCAQWMRELGERHAWVTPGSHDGGVDVVSEHCLVQVKNWQAAVGRPPVADLLAVTARDGRRAVLFAASGYTAPAVTLADRAGVALFVYDPLTGALDAASDAAELALRGGFPPLGRQ